MAKELSQEQLYLACRRVENVIYEFRQRAGTELVCAQLHRTWESHFDQIVIAWDGLTLPARRCMVQNMREKVIKRARALHRIVVKDKSRRRLPHKEKERIVSKLMEKICSELFDTDVLYNDHNLLSVLGNILECGGGSECPPLVVAEVYHSFDVTEESIKRSRSTNHVQNNSSLNKHGQTQRSVEDMRWLRRQESSACVVDLLSFLPQEMELEARKALTIKLVSEMRNAFLVHFAVLVFGELIDDYDSVVRKYEYGSESETECATSETDWSDSDVEDESEGVDEYVDSLDSDEGIGIVIEATSDVPEPRDVEFSGKSLTTPRSWTVGEQQYQQVALSDNGVDDNNNNEKNNDNNNKNNNDDGVEGEEMKREEGEREEVKEGSEGEAPNMQLQQQAGDVVGKDDNIETNLRLASREAHTVVTR